MWEYLLNNTDQKSTLVTNSLKKKDALSRIVLRNIMLMIFYLNVFQLPTLIQVVGQYKMWNKVVFWFA